MAESNAQPTGIAALRDEMLADLPPVLDYDFSFFDEGLPGTPQSVFEMIQDDPFLDDVAEEPAHNDDADESEPRDTEA